jgi:hypothetical protein
MVDDKHDDPAHHDPMMDHDHTDTHGDDQSVWHDQPVDDFHDDPATATTSEDHDMPESEASAEHDVMAIEKKRSPIVGIAIVAVGVIFLGAIAYMQFGSMLMGAPPAPPAVPSAAGMPKMPPLEDPANVAPKSAMIAASVASPTASSPTAVAQTGIAIPEKSAAPIPASIEATHTPPGPVTNESPRTTPPTQTAAVAPAPMMPSPSSMAPPTSMAPASTQPTIAEPPTTTSAKTMQAVADIQQSDDQRLSALAGRVDSLQKSLEAATQKLSEVSLKLSTEPTLSPSINPAIDERLSRIEQKLSQVEQPSAKSSANIDTVKTASLDNAEIVAPTYSQRKSSAYSHRHHVRHASHTRRQTRKPVVKNNWVLRAASADQAWVSTSSTGAKLRSVRVGDELPGIGKVRAIIEGSNGWVVQGSKGSVN